jgi:SAM-dependent methyltransferase
MLIPMIDDETQAMEHTGSAAWARAFAFLYDPFLWAGERAGVRTLRRNVLSKARGCTVEVGSGTGLNLRYYPEDLDELVLAEPDPSMRVRLEKRLRRTGRRARVVDAPAERLPFSDGSVDTVVSTFLLCTVAEPELALREMLRVLRADGQLLFIEHVRAASPRLARWQDRLAHPWSRFARGCRCNQSTAELFDTCGLSLSDVHAGAWRAMPPIVRPLIAGSTQARTNHG